MGEGTFNKKTERKRESWLMGQDKTCYDTCIYKPWDRSQPLQVKHK
jgi:hypothetical protein